MGGPTPKRKHSKSRKRDRMHSRKVELPDGVVCKNCSKLKLSHRICPHCNK